MSQGEVAAWTVVIAGISFYAGYLRGCTLTTEIAENSKLWKIAHLFAETINFPKLLEEEPIRDDFQSNYEQAKSCEKRTTQNFLLKQAINQVNIFRNLREKYYMYNSYETENLIISIVFHIDGPFSEIDRITKIQNKINNLINSPNS